MTFVLSKDWVRQKQKQNGAPRFAFKKPHLPPPENRTTTNLLLLGLRLVLVLRFHLAALAVLLRIVLAAFCIVRGVVLSTELTRFTTTVSVILISMLGATLGTLSTTLGAFLTATVCIFVFARAFGATLLALGTTRFGFLLIGLRCAGLTLAHCDRKGSQEEGEQHNEYSALSGFHFGLLSE
jgi:hypothetical protein